MWRKYARWGLFDFHTQKMPHPVCYSAAFDPDGFKRAAYEMTGEAEVKLRLHSWFSSAIVEDGTIKGVVVETKEGRQAIMGDVVIDATGDLDVAASAGAKFQRVLVHPDHRLAMGRCRHRPRRGIPVRQPRGVRAP